MLAGSVYCRLQLPFSAANEGQLMASRSEHLHQRPSTRLSDDGDTVWVTLRVSRQAYELARYWARFHAGAMPNGTAEDQLEGYLNTAMLEALSEAPEDFKRDWPEPPTSSVRQSDLDDDIPF